MAFRAIPSNTSKLPAGIPYIIGNEAAERFSFYGMKAALVIFMTSYLHLMGDKPTDALSPLQANANHHWFVTAVYLTPLFGAFLSDRYLGKYTTIILLSLVYCAGHLALAFMGVTGPASWWFIAGLGLIAIGGGGIKPCVSAHVGDQFGPNNQHLLSKVFNWFYFSINLGAALSNILIPWVLLWHGPHWAFGIPGALMILATILFWIGRHSFIHVPPARKTFTKELFSKTGRQTILKLCSIFLFIPIFWTLFDQTASSWVFQALDMNRTIWGIDILPSQVQAANPFLILLLIPLFSYVIYPALEKIVKLTPLRKIGAGLFLTSIAFALSAIIQGWIDAGEQPSIVWQLLAYIILTSGEIMVSIVCLEFAYTQAPKSMKSIVMALFLVSVALGNAIAAIINIGIQAPSPLKHETADAQSAILKSTSSPSTLQPDWNSLKYAGFDNIPGTSDDINIHFNSNYIVEKREIPGSNIYLKASKLIEQFHAESSLLPSKQEAQKLIETLKDPWGSPLRYRRLNKYSYRIDSIGPDKKNLTKWDQGIIVHYTAHEAILSLSKKKTWLEKRKLELGIKTSTTEISEEPSNYDRSYFVGGLSRLEGANYFWFFTGLMTLTSIVFIPVAINYKPTKI